MIAILNRIPDPAFWEVGNKSLHQGLSYYHTPTSTGQLARVGTLGYSGFTSFSNSQILKSSNPQILNLSPIKPWSRDISPHHDHDHDHDQGHGHEDAHDELMMMIIVDCLLQVDPA